MFYYLKEAKTMPGIYLEDIFEHSPLSLTYTWKKCSTCGEMVYRVACSKISTCSLCRGKHVRSYHKAWYQRRKKAKRTGDK